MWKQCNPKMFQQMEVGYTAAVEARDNYRGDGSTPSSQLPKGGQAYVAAGQNSQMKEIGGGQNWRYGVIDCFKNPAWCLMGCLNPGALIYAIMDKTQNPAQGKKLLMWRALFTLLFNASFASMLFLSFKYTIPRFIMCIILLCILWVFVAIYYYQLAQLRKQTRARYGIEEDDYMDYLIAACCFEGNFLLQMFNEVHAREGVEIV